MSTERLIADHGLTLQMREVLREVGLGYVLSHHVGGQYFAAYSGGARAVTATVRALERRGLIEPGDFVRRNGKDRWWKLTPEGQALLQRMGSEST